MPDFLAIPEVCELLRVAERTVYQRCTSIASDHHPPADLLARHRNDTENAYSSVWVSPIGESAAPAKPQEKPHEIVGHIVVGTGTRSFSCELDLDQTHSRAY